MSLQIYHGEFGEIPEAHRSFYVADPENGWKLDCDIDDVVRGLKRALNQERGMRAFYDEKLRALLTPNGFKKFRKFCRNAVRRDAQPNPAEAIAETVTAVEAV